MSVDDKFYGSYCWLRFCQINGWRMSPDTYLWFCILIVFLASLWPFYDKQVRCIASDLERKRICSGGRNGLLRLWDATINIWAWICMFTFCNNFVCEKQGTWWRGFLHYFCCFPVKYIIWKISDESKLWTQVWVWLSLLQTGHSRELYSAPGSVVVSFFCFFLSCS